MDQALDYVRARWLDLLRANWLARDPVRAAPSSYTDRRNNPCVHVDPTGLFSITACTGNRKPMTMKQLLAFLQLPDTLVGRQIAGTNVEQAVMAGRSGCLPPLEPDGRPYACPCVGPQYTYPDGVGPLAGYFWDLKTGESLGVMPNSVFGEVKAQTGYVGLWQQAKAQNSQIACQIDALHHSPANSVPARRARAFPHYYLVGIAETFFNMRGIEQFAESKRVVVQFLKIFGVEPPDFWGNNIAVTRNHPGFGIHAKKVGTNAEYTDLTHACKFRR